MVKINYCLLLFFISNLTKLLFTTRILSRNMLYPDYHNIIIKLPKTEYLLHTVMQNSNLVLQSQCVLLFVIDFEPFHRPRNIFEYVYFRR